VAAALRVDTAVILLPDPAGENLLVRAALGLEEEVAQGVRVPIGRGIAGRIAATRAPYVADDVGAVEVVSHYLQERIRSLMGVPLLVEDRLIGVLHVGSLAPRRFGSDELRLLQLVGERVALAIENAHLYAAERAARDEAEAAVRLRDDVLTLATHDLRAPLTAILGRADVARSRLHSRLHSRVPLDVTWLDSQLDAIAAAARRMVAIIAELDDAAQVRMGQTLRLHIEELELPALVRRVAAEQTTAMGSAPVMVEAPEASLVVGGDGERLARVLHNLIGNAIKYSPEATPVQVRVYVEGTWAVVSIRDRGVGIPAAELPGIFTRFFRASTAQGVPGTGIGLAGSKAIVEQHGGAIAVASTLGAGTTVTVRLPLTQEASLPTPGSH
jgi:signal transduction histidine kinase